MLDSWLWNLVPLGIAKFIARRWGGPPVDVRLGLGAFGPFPCRNIGGVLVRATVDGGVEP